MDTALFNFAKGPMFRQMLGEAEYKLHGSQVEGAVQAVFLIGWALGGLAFGILADRWGRSRTLILTVLLYCGFTGLTALCRNPGEVAMARFLTALGVGGEWAAGAALVAESVPDSARIWASSVLQTAAAFGPMLAALANFCLAGRHWSLLFLIGIVPALITFFLRRNMAASHFEPLAKGNPLQELFSTTEWRRRAISAAFVGAVGVTGAMTATYWQPNLVAAASHGLPKLMVNQRQSLTSVVSHLGTLAGVLVVPWLCGRFGRRSVIAAFFTLTPLVVALAIGGGVSFGRLLLLAPLINFFAIGVSAAFVLYFPELFPARMRATGAGFAYNVGRALAIPMPIFTGFVIASTGGSVASGVLMSGGIYVIGPVALGFGRETHRKPMPN